MKLCQPEISYHQGTGMHAASGAQAEVRGSSSARCAGRLGAGLSSMQSMARHSSDSILCAWPTHFASGPTGVSATERVEVGGGEAPRREAAALEDGGCAGRLGAPPNSTALHCGV